MNRSDGCGDGRSVNRRALRAAATALALTPILGPMAILLGAAAAFFGDSPESGGAAGCVVPRPRPTPGSGGCSVHRSDRKTSISATPPKRQWCPFVPVEFFPISRLGSGAFLDLFLGG